MAEESAIRCCTSATFDLKTVKARCKHEGLSFLTITLPEFGKDFQKSLDQGQVDRHLFAGFQRKAELPRFLGGFLDRVFDRSSGRLLEEPCIDSILAVRQLTLMFGKMDLPCSDARVRSAMRGFIECEQDVKRYDQARSSQMRDEFAKVGSVLFRDLFTRVDSDIYEGKYIPRHGPGSTADRLTGNRKFEQRTWPARLEQIFRMDEMLLPNGRYYDLLESIDVLEPGSEIPVKVISVPKTLKTPRIIAQEPTAMQYAQQAVRDVIRGHLERDDILSKFISPEDQTPNQELALVGSLYGNLATLDLSEASDRVSNQLVRDLFRSWPWLNGAVDASRSRKAEVLVGEEKFNLRLAKFASMGSGLTFDVEAMVFLTLVFVAIQRDLNRTLTRRDVKRLVGSVRVYGDDIIVPVDYVHTVVSVLEDFGLRVNRGKSFWTGRFRESCGKDYYHGHDVSIVRYRGSKFPTQRQHATEFNKLSVFRNQCYFAGYWQTARWIDDHLLKVFRHYPVVAPTSSVLGRHSFLGYENQRTDPLLHTPLVKGYAEKAQLPRDVLDGEGALLKYLLSKQSGFLPWETPDTSQREAFVRSLKVVRPLSQDEDHLERAGRPKRVDIKLGWYKPY